MLSQGRDTQVVKASQRDVMTHFKAFFNKPSRATDIDDEFLSNFPVFSGEDVVSLNSEFTVVELREVV